MSTKVVMIVDDEPANIDLIKGILPSHVKCKAAVNGTIALKQLSKQTPDLVFLDLVMPGMDGVEVLEAIRKFASNVELPVIIVSGNKEDAQLAKLNELGITGYLTKPVDSDTLLAMAKAHIGN